MSILKYFKLIPKASVTLFEELPDLNDTLSKTMLPSAIMANDETLKMGYGSYTQSNCVLVYMTSSNDKNMSHTIPHQLWLHNEVYRITVNTVILIFLITGVYIFAKVYFTKCILSSYLPVYPHQGLPLYDRSCLDSVQLLGVIH